MGRHSRQFATRLQHVVLATAVGGLLYYRWTWRSAICCDPPPHSALTPLTRTQRFEALRLSKAMRVDGDSRASVEQLTINGRPEKVWDVLVIGGGVIGMQMALEATRRGLTVVVAEARDLGSGMTSHGPGLSPGLFAYFQRALRQRESEWVWAGLRVLQSQKLWWSVCCNGSRETDNGVERRGLRFWLRPQARSGASGVEEKRVAVVAAHRSEWLEFCFLQCMASITHFVLWGSPSLKRSWLSSQQVRDLGSNAGASHSDPAVAGEGISSAYGAVVSTDCWLNGPLLAVRVARTAEALGAMILTYAPVLSLNRIKVDEESREQPHASMIFCATVGDALGVTDSPMPTHSIYARGVINCAGAWADEIRHLMPDASVDQRSSTHVFEPHVRLQQYLVAPNTAVYPLAVGSSSPVSKEKSNTSWLGGLGIEGLHVESTRFASPTLVLPWNDECVLVGPAFGVFPILPSLRAPRAEDAVMNPLRYHSAMPHIRDEKRGSDEGGGGRSATMLDRLLESIRVSGVGIDRAAVLSCLSGWSPAFLPPTQVPWLGEFVLKGYKVLITDDSAASESPSAPSSFSETPSTAPRSPLMRALRPASFPSSSPVSSEGQSPTPIPFLHIYGGEMVEAPRIATDALNALLSLDTYFPSRSVANLTKNHTPLRPIALLPIPWELASSPSVAQDWINEGVSHSESTAEELSQRDDSISPYSNAAAVPAIGVERAISSMVREGYACSVSDVIFRRLRVAYTSPGEALQAVKGIAQLIGKEMNWNANKINQEIHFTLSEVEKVGLSLSD